jgi:two-component system NarL family response regulator
MTTSPGKPIRILVVEDHYLAALALSTVISDEPELELVARAETGWEAVSLFTKHKPDLVIMDLRLPDLDGVAATAAILRADPKARVLVLSNSETEEDVRRALAAGAAGYLKKDVQGKILLDAIRGVASGRSYVPSEVAARLEEGDDRSRLTRRELGILQLVAQGRSNDQLAAELGISEGTVRVHMSNILLKLGVKRRTEAVAVALKRGLVRIE